MNKKLIKEGTEKAVAEFAGYTIYHKDGKWYQTKGDIKRGKGLTSDQLWEKHGDAYKRHIESRRDPNADAVASGASPDRHESFDLFPQIMSLLEKREKSLKQREISLLMRQGATAEDIRDYSSGNKKNRRVARMLTRAYKDATIKQDAGGSIDEESAWSEEVEYNGEELEESGRFTPSSPYNNKKQSRTSLSRGYQARGMENGLPGPDNSPYGRARMRGAGLKGKKKIIDAKDRATNTMFAHEFGEELFHKDTDRLLREHIRAEYEARGMYPTAREVQETFNQVMSLLEKVSAEEKARRNISIYGDETPEEKAMRRRGIVGGSRAAHIRRRGKPTKISPSSPARKQSRVEKDTRFLMGQGFSPDHLRRIMSDPR